MIIAKYYDNNRECIGSDSYLPLDGRLSLLHMRYYVLDHPHTKFMLDNKHATHFKIIKTNSLLEDGISLTTLLSLSQ